MLRNPEKVLEVFTLLHGPESTDVTHELLFDDNEDICGVGVFKGENMCWSVSLVELAFDYAVRKL